jgi:molybdate transport system substrate-binding protein
LNEVAPVSLIRRGLLPLLLLALFSACGQGAASPTTAAATAAATTAAATAAATTVAATAGPTNAAPVELTILGAASLKGALDKAKAAYEAANPGVRLTISTDSSSALETKIEQGAPSDLFLSADTTNPQKLVDGGFASGAPVSFAGNKLVIVVPTGNPGGLQSPMDLAKSGVDVIAAGDAVPITKYATTLVQNLAALPGYPADFAAKYAANVASKEENVKSVIGKIELGQGDAAIVYVTDAKASRKAEAIEVTPDSANVPATYAGVVIKAATQQAAAKAFLDWFAGPDGQVILASYGFLPPPA